MAEYEDPRKDPAFARQLYDWLVADPSRIMSRKGVRSLDEWPAEREKLLMELKATFDG